MEKLRIGCVVMAAGNASRFGRNKLAAEVDGKTLLRRALEAVPPGRFCRVAVVTQYPEAAEAARRFSFTPVKNRHPDWGISHTISLGLDALGDCDAALFLVSDSLLFRTMVRTEQRVQLEVENELLERQLDAQLAHYRDLTAQYEQIRAMRHDIAHHLNTIHALLEAGNLQAASEYSEQLLPAQTYSSRLGACRNPVVDAFLYTRVQDAQAKGIPVQADVSLPVELPVSNTDLIVAFGNLLDNALEACSGIPDAQITLRAHMDKGYLVIQESNPVRPRQPQGKKPRRIPELERGVGFRVLSGLAQKYDGSFRHTCENDTYTVTLLLRAAAAGVPAVPAHV
mgnify:CR=1 FL=1